MASNLESLLTGKHARSSKKLLGFNVKPEVHAAFRRACALRKVPQSACLEAMVLDFIQTQLFLEKMTSFGTERIQAPTMEQRELKLES